MLDEESVDALGAASPTVSPDLPLQVIYVPLKARGPSFGPSSALEQTIDSIFIICLVKRIEEKETRCVFSLLRNQKMVNTVHIMISCLALLPKLPCSRCLL